MENDEKNLDLRELRRKLGMNQEVFWGLLGVTQSGGSRYESGREMPRPVQELLRIVHIERVDTSKIRKEDIDLVDYLKVNHAALYREYKKEARLWAKAGRK